MDSLYVGYNQKCDCYLRLADQKWSLTQNRKEAKEMTRDKLKSVINNYGHMTPGTWECIPVDNDSPASVSPSGISEPSQQTCKESCAVCGTWDLNDSCKGILDVLDAFADTVNDKRLKQLAEDLSEADREITDIQHYIEFNILNASQGYKMYKMLRDVLIKRRGIKNEYEIIQSVLGSKCASVSNRSIQHKFEGGLSKRYKPRLLDDLFKGGS